jgi:hypothetical protein
MPPQKEYAMNKRREVQKEHERFLFHTFLEWYNSKNSAEYKVIEEPDPPEAVIKWGNDIKWIEVVDVFYSHELARDKYSYATPGERHIPMSPGPHQSMDSNYSIIFISELKKKLQKRTYLPFKVKYGPGILIIGTHNPWFHVETVSMMKEKFFSEDWSEDLGCFNSIYISFSSLNDLVFRLWPEEA